MTTPHATSIAAARETGAEASDPGYGVLSENPDFVETVEAVAEWIEERDVKDSGGRVERRPVIRTTVGIGGRSWPIEITLSRRDDMGFRMLLGRHAVRRRFLIDPKKSFLAGQPKGGPERG